MKITIKHAEEVKTIARDYYGILLSDKQVQQLIEGSSSIREELRDGSLSDTCARSMLADEIIKKVMSGEENPKNRDTFGSGWSWPLGGSLPAYVEEFKIKFKCACDKHDVKLIEGWEEDW